MKDKRGQKIESPTVHVAIFVLLMALFIIGYLVLLPKSERERLLGTGEEYEPDEYEEGIEVEKEILLSVSPGAVYPYSKETEEKDLASVNLYSTTKTSPVMLADKVVVTRSLFRNNYKELNFDLDSLADLAGLGLFFSTGDAKGNLVVIINNNEVYRGRVLGDLPIDIPSEYLKNYNNKLILEAASVGWMFLSVNEFTLKDVQLIKQISLENKVEMRSFVVDVDGLRKGKLGFFINCLKINVEQGRLKIDLNGRNLYVGKVVCDAGSIDVDLVKNYFVDGRNTLTFNIDKGEYVLERVKLELDVEKKSVPQYYFSIDEVKVKYILKMNFEESSEVKRATITINGDNLYLDEYGNSYKKDITELIREGENYIKVIAKNEFVIDLFEVVRE